MAWPLFQLDEQVYMKQPQEYIDQGENIVCRLRKAIYGLQKSPRAWFEKFNMVISDIKFAHCDSDHTVFICHTKSGSVILAMY